MAEQSLVEIVRLYVGRGLRTNPFGETDEKLELSVNLPDLGVELDQALEPFQAARQRVWLPLTSVVSGVPVLVWDDNDGLVPTHVPIGDDT
jgi:hypothetical protein